jgi:hypothetical protein
MLGYRCFNCGRWVFDSEKACGCQKINIGYPLTPNTPSQPVYTYYTYTYKTVQTNKALYYLKAKLHSLEYAYKHNTSLSEKESVEYAAQIYLVKEILEFLEKE